MTTALVLAGSRGPGDPLAGYAGVSHKALIKVGGAPMLVRVVRALASAGVRRIAVSIERPELVTDLARSGAFPTGVTVEPIAASSGPSQSVGDALDCLGAPLLVTTADHPLLRPEWVRHFLQAVPQRADIAAALARSDVVQAAAPDTKRTYIRFADGSFSGCNLFYFATARGARAAETWKAVEADRKKPLRMIGRLGPLTALKFALGRLTLAEGVARLGRIAGVEAAVVEMPFGEAAIDVDKPADLDLVRRILDQNPQW